MPVNCHQDIADVILVVVQGHRESKLPLTEAQKSCQDDIDALRPSVSTIRFCHADGRQWHYQKLPRKYHAISCDKVLCEMVIQE